MSKFLVFIVSVVLSALSVAQETNASKKFSDMLIAIDTLTGRFEQTIYDTEGKALQKTEGKFKVKRPGYFLWEIAPPYEQTVVGTPTSLKVYDPDLEQMTVHAQDSLAGSPASLISGDVDAIAADYDVNLQAQDNVEIFTLKQKNAEQGSFDSLLFSFVQKRKEKYLSEMSFIDKLGQKTKIVVSELKLNKNISDKKFEFVPPKGTDIIVDE